MSRCLANPNRKFFSPKWEHERLRISPAHYQFHCDQALAVRLQTHTSELTSSTPGRLKGRTQQQGTLLACSQSHMQSSFNSNDQHRSLHLTFAELRLEGTRSLSLPHNAVSEMNAPLLGTQHSDRLFQCAAEQKKKYDTADCTCPS